MTILFKHQKKLEVSWWKAGKFRLGRNRNTFSYICKDNKYLLVDLYRFPVLFEFLLKQIKATNKNESIPLLLKGLNLLLRLVPTIQDIWQEPADPANPSVSTKTLIQLSEVKQIVLFLLQEINNVYLDFCHYS